MTKNTLLTTPKAFELRSLVHYGIYQTLKITGRALSTNVTLQNPLNCVSWAFTMTLVKLSTTNEDNANENNLLNAGSKH